MAYRDDMLALNPDHLWVMDPALTDSVGSLTLTNSSMALTGAVICEDITNSLASTATSHRLSVATSTDVDGALDRKLVCGWFRTTAIQPPPKSIYREGTTNSQFNIIMWAGNNVMFEVVNSGTVIQAFADQVFQVNRAYHIAALCEGTGYGDKVELFIDGVKQSTTGTLGSATLPARTAAEWADPSGSTEVGNQTVLLNAPVNGNFAMWATFSGANAQLTDTEIREELFEKGALPGVTISSDTEANMQTALDAYADTVRGDEPLNIRIEDVSGGGNLSLDADNITHNSLASCHIQWMGTGELSWTNSNGSDTSIGSSPNSGTINFINPVTLITSPLVAGSEVRVYESGTANEVGGTESSGTSFNTSISVSTVDVVIIKNDYEYIRVNNLDMSSGDVSLPVSQQFDRNYENS